MPWPGGPRRALVDEKTTKKSSGYLHGYSATERERLRRQVDVGIDALHGGQEIALALLGHGPASAVAGEAQEPYPEALCAPKQAHRRDQKEDPSAEPEADLEPVCGPYGGDLVLGEHRAQVDRQISQHGRRGEARGQADQRQRQKHQNGRQA